jgi:hypothetical protein
MPNLHSAAGLARAELEAAIWRTWAAGTALRTPDVEAILGAADSYAEAVHDEHAGHDRLMEAAREARDYRKQAVRWGR